MFQDFSPPKNTGSTCEKLADLRDQMRTAKAHWFLVPHADAHQNEYLPERAERLAWITGFTGSAGFALIGLEQAFVFVDGRYTVQAANQVDEKHFEICDLVSNPPAKFARDHIGKGESVAFDPWLITMAQEKAWKKSAAACGALLVATDNLIDRIWKDQPAPPSGRAWLHPLQYTGKETSQKIEELQATIKSVDTDCCLLTDPASIAWAFNLRGSDVVHNPLALAFAILPARGRPTLFIDSGKFSAADRNALTKITKIASIADLLPALRQLSPGSKVHCDPNLVAFALTEELTKAGCIIVEKRDPVTLPRALKNATELQGARSAHLRDGVAMTRFLYWLDQQKPGTISEIDAAKKLEDCRRKTAKAMGSRLEEISFDTISGAGANGAIVHYRVNDATNATIGDNSLYLVDSGGQYLDGTTDITRTIAIGTPPPAAITNNTLVLKGHIALATARFPEGTRGVDLDPLARTPLWRAGKDFAHGTGHGIGSYLNVHEGPQSVSKRGMEALKPGMILSNEPGYYKQGEYGIRIENLVIVSEASDVEGGDKPMLGFETITLCPIDIRLIDPNMLSKKETDWLNAYHARVYAELSPHLEADETAWLKQATRGI